MSGGKSSVCAFAWLLVLFVFIALPLSLSLALSLLLPAIVDLRRFLALAAALVRSLVHLQGVVPERGTIALDCGFGGLRLLESHIGRLCRHAYVGDFPMLLEELPQLLFCGGPRQAADEHLRRAAFSSLCLAGDDLAAH